MISVRALLALLLCIFVLPDVVFAQTLLTPGVKFIDKSSGHSHDWKVAASASSNQVMTFPSAPGTVGQVLKVVSTTDGNATFGWTTSGASAAQTSTRLATNVDDVSAWSTGPDITVECGKKYRIVGEFAVSRGTSGATDQVKFQINCPTGTYAAYGIESVDCPTSDLPQFISGTAGGGQSVGPTDEIDPTGSQEGVTYTYRIEGVLKVVCAGTTGTVRLTFNKSGGGSTTQMKANSYWTLIEIQ